MNKVVTSVIAVGAGVAAFGLARRNNMFSGRQMKKLQKRMTKAIF